jgi:hypothetical protein
VLEARFVPTRSTLPISPLDERRTRSVSAHIAFTSVCRHSSIVSESLHSSSIFTNFFWHSSVENLVLVENAENPLKIGLFRHFLRLGSQGYARPELVSFRNWFDDLRLRCSFAFATIRGFLPVDLRVPFQPRRRIDAILLKMRSERWTRRPVLQHLRAAYVTHRRTSRPAAPSTGRTVSTCVR